MKTTARHAILARPHPLLRTIFIAAVALAIGTIAAPAASAQKQTESEIKAGCDEAGGVYHTRVDSDGGNTTTCCYRDNEGHRYCDMFIDGNYIDTSPGKAPPPVSGPAAPPANNAPIQTNPPPAAH